MGRLCVLVVRWWSVALKVCQAWPCPGAHEGLLALPRGSGASWSVALGIAQGLLIKLAIWDSVFWAATRKTCVHLVCHIPG